MNTREIFRDKYGRIYRRWYFVGMTLFGIISFEVLYELKFPPIDQLVPLLIALVGFIVIYVTAKNQDF